MKSRLWYPQLDIPSAARRILKILSVWKLSTLSAERLLILDFFLASPSLINDIKMPSDLRKQYSALRLPKQKDEFVVLPASTLLFHSMVPIQKKALNSLVAKDLIDRNEYEFGQIRLTNIGKQTAAMFDKPSSDTTEDSALHFLCGLLASQEFESKLELRSRTELRYYE